MDDYNILDDILMYYKNTYRVDCDLSDIKDELLANNVEVNCNSFYCPIWNDDIGGWILLAGTKDKADSWVLKKIIRLIKSGDKIYTILNGNSEKILPMLKKYNVNVISEKDGYCRISFNT